VIGAGDVDLSTFGPVWVWHRRVAAGAVGDCDHRKLRNCTVARQPQAIADAAMLRC
jgi:hypothetical protein